MNKFVVLLILILVAGTYAQLPNLTATQMNYGSPMEAQYARSLAMGATGYAGGIALHAPMLNPALLTRASKQIEGSVLGWVYNREEDRAYPYYDSFGGFIDFGSYVYNSNTYGGFALTGITQLPFARSLNLNMGVAFNALLDFNYNYLEEVRSDQFGDALLAYNKIESNGAFRELSFSLGANIIPALAVGLKLGIVTGSVSQKLEIFPYDQSLESIHQIETNEITLSNTPLNVNIGLLYQVDEKFSIGTIFKLPLTIETENQYEIKTNSTTTSSQLDIGSKQNLMYSSASKGFDSTAQANIKRELKYPLALGIGIEYRFTNVLEARINADFEYTFWSKFEDDLNPDINFSDTYAIRVGLEHIFFDKMPFRVGFNYQPLKENKQYTRTVLTIGIGVLFDNLEIDLSGGLEGLTTNQLDLFDDGNYPPLVSRADPVDRVQSNYLYGMIEFRFGLDSIY